MTCKVPLVSVDSSLLCVQAWCHCSLAYRIHSVRLAYSTRNFSCRHMCQRDLTRSPAAVFAPRALRRGCTTARCEHRRVSLTATRTRTFWTRTALTPNKSPRTSLGSFGMWMFPRRVDTKHRPSAYKELYGTSHTSPRIYSQEQQV